MLGSAHLAQERVRAGRTAPCQPYILARTHVPTYAAACSPATHTHCVHTDSPTQLRTITLSRADRAARRLPSRR